MNLPKRGLQKGNRGQGKRVGKSGGSGKRPVKTVKRPGK